MKRESSSSEFNWQASTTLKPDSTVKSAGPTGFGERFLVVPAAVVDGGGLQEALKQGMLTERKPKGEFR